eukprot:scaffold356520_cov45-Prasinocladus_malaysianus.AAC.1
MSKDEDPFAADWETTESAGDGYYTYTAPESPSTPEAIRAKFDGVCRCIHSDYRNVITVILVLLYDTVLRYLQFNCHETISRAQESLTQ